MKQLFRFCVVVIAITASAQSAKNGARVIDLNTSDGTVLKASYFAASKPGRGVLLLHPADRERKSWDSVASQLASAGLNTLTLEMRGRGGSSGKPGDTIT